MNWHNFNKYFWMYFILFGLAYALIAIGGKTYRFIHSLPKDPLPATKKLPPEDHQKDVQIFEPRTGTDKVPFTWVGELEISPEVTQSPSENSQNCFTLEEVIEVLRIHDSQKRRKNE